ncbi:MAG: hypothetical protein KKF77_03440 [Proteobacteria bacterium]|nr:hypothetical protein [Pseudomonadota bacterium]
MTILADIAAIILAQQGESVTYTPQASDPEAEAVELQAVVSHHGFGYAPASWPEDLFRNQARHAAVRLRAADVAAEPTKDDSIALDGLTYRVRAVSREPRTGPEAMWWICLCACDQRGKY